MKVSPTDRRAERDAKRLQRKSEKNGTAPATAPVTATGETQYQVEEKDTVSGRLGQIDYNNPAYKRVSSEAKEVSNSRGLTRSTIAAGTGIGAMLDKAVDVAKVDSSNIINTGNQNSVNATSKDIAVLNSDTQKEIQQLQARENRTNLASELESRAAINTQNVNATNINLRTELTSREGVAARELASSNTNQAANRNIEVQRLRSQEMLAGNAIEADALKAEFDRSNQLLITNLNNENNLIIEEMRQQYQRTALTTSVQNQAWDSYQAGLGNIDPNATSSSQNTQFNRVTDAFESRMKFITGDYTPPKASTPSAPSTSGGNTTAQPAVSIPRPRVEPTPTSGYNPDNPGGAPAGSYYDNWSSGRGR